MSFRVRAHSCHREEGPPSLTRLYGSSCIARARRICPHVGSRRVDRVDDDVAVFRVFLCGWAQTSTFTDEDEWDERISSRGLRGSISSGVAGLYRLWMNLELVGGTSVRCTHVSAWISERVSGRGGTSLAVRDDFQIPGTRTSRITWPRSGRAPRLLYGRDQFGRLAYSLNPSVSLWRQLRKTKQPSQQWWQRVPCLITYMPSPGIRTGTWDWELVYGDVIISCSEKVSFQLGDWRHPVWLWSESPCWSRRPVELGAPANEARTPRFLKKRLFRPLRTCVALMLDNEDLNDMCRSRLKIYASNAIWIACWRETPSLMGPLHWDESGRVPVPDECGVRPVMLFSCASIIVVTQTFQEWPSRSNPSMSILEPSWALYLSVQWWLLSVIDSVTILSVSFRCGLEYAKFTPRGWSRKFCPLAVFAHFERSVFLLVWRSI